MDVDMIFFFHLNTALGAFPFHFRISCKDSAPRLLRVFRRPPAKFRQSLAYFLAIPCEPCSRSFFCYGEIFLPNMRGPLGCLLGFWLFGPKPCGSKNNLSKFIITSFILILHTAQFWHGAAPISPPCRKFMQVKQNHVARLIFFANIRGKDTESALPLLNSENH